MNNNRLLIIFIKNLEKGKVKTRLASTLGDKEALNVYKKLTNYTREVASAVKADKQVWYSSFIPKADEWDGEEFIKELQEGADLGQRMKHAFKSAFDKEYQKVVIIGSDCAELTPDLLNLAYQKLEKNELVAGPSEDGGYYLLGMNAFYGDLFEGIQWSTSKVLSQTLQKAKELALDFELLPERNDVDYEEDWLAVKDQL